MWLACVLRGERCGAVSMGLVSLVKLVLPVAVL